MPARSVAGVRSKTGKKHTEQSLAVAEVRAALAAHSKRNGRALKQHTPTGMAWKNLFARITKAAATGEGIAGISAGEVEMLNRIVNASEAERRGNQAVWRELFNSPLWKADRVYSEAEALLALLFAGYDEEMKLTLNHGVRASQRELATRWRWTQSAVFRFLKKLSDIGWIESLGESHSTNITITPLGVKRNGPPDSESLGESSHGLD